MQARPRPALLSTRLGLTVFAAGALACLLPARSVTADDAPDADWSAQQIAKLPASEKPVHLFNGVDLTNWEGQIGKYW